MFENLSERLERSFKILKGEGKITEINVAETLKDVRRALLDADVNYKVRRRLYLDCGLFLKSTRLFCHSRPGKSY